MHSCGSTAEGAFGLYEQMTAAGERVISVPHLAHIVHAVRGKRCVVFWVVGTHSDALERVCRPADRCPLVS